MTGPSTFTCDDRLIGCLFVCVDAYLLDYDSGMVNLLPVQTMEVEDKDDVFDPDAIILMSFLQEQKAILHDNVVKTSHVIHSKSSLKHLLAFDLSVRIYLDVHPDP